MYPNLYFFLKDVFGFEVHGLKFINSFGFFVALAFLAAAVTLTSELKRRQRNGWLLNTETTVLVGQGAKTSDIIWNFVFGFIFGFKFLGLAFANSIEISDPQTYLFSKQGNPLLGILLGGALAFWRWYVGNKTKQAKPEKRTIRIWPHDRVGDMIVYAALFGFGGAKLFHNLENFSELIKDPIGALLSFSGLTFYGGLICAGAAIIWYARRHKINLWHLVDSFGPAMMIAYAVGRIGCQVAGDGDWGVLNSAYTSNEQGKSILADTATFNANLNKHAQYYYESFPNIKNVTELEHISVKAPSWLPNWSVAYTYKNNVLNEGIKLPGKTDQWQSYLPSPVFPTPLYEVIVSFIFFFILWAMRKKLKMPGMLFGIYLIMNGVERFLIEKIRVNTTYSIFGFHPTQAEIISTILVLLGIFIIVNRRNKTAIIVNGEKGI